jgi:CheY-like chemotaxis protein
MARIRVVHWREEEAVPILELLRVAGHELEYERDAPTLLRAAKQAPPDAIVIDLTRLPSHGLEIATALRNAKATRLIPILFVDGAPEKVEAIRAKLPDAIYTTRAGLMEAIAGASPPAAPVAPAPMMDRYAGRSAAQKLGIRESCRVSLIDPPRDYAHVIGALPGEVQMEENPATPGDVTLWFVTDADTYRHNLPSRRDWAAHTKFWVLWRKKTKGINENLIRDAGLEMGLVDYKVCSVNATWSALLFAKRKGV